MAFIYRSMLAPALELFNTSSRIYNRFDKAWGKKTIDGIQVYSDKLYYYESGQYNQDESFKRFLTSLGVSHDEMINTPVDSEIESMWFKINTGFKWDGTVRPSGEYSLEDWNTDSKQFDPTQDKQIPEKQDIVDSLNSAINVGDTVYITIQYGGGTKRYIEDHSLTWEATGIDIVAGALDTVAIRNKIESNPWYYIANSRHKPYVSDSLQFQLYDGANIDTPTQVIRPTNKNVPPCSVSIALEEPTSDIGGIVDMNIPLALFALIDNGTSFERLDGITNEHISTVTTSRYEGEVLQYSYTISYKYLGTSVTSYMINDMFTWYDSYNQGTAKNNDELVTSTLDTIMKKVLDYHMIAEDTDSLYCRGRLRVHEASLMKRKDFVNMLVSKLDTDYKVEEASWWEKALSIIIVIVAVFVGFMTGGTTWAGIATGLAWTSAVLTVGMLMLSQFGGLSAQGLVQKIGAFAQIVGYAALVAGVMNAIKELATRSLISEGLTAAQATAQVTEQSLAENVTLAVKESVTSAISEVKSLFTGEMSITVDAVRDGVSLVNKAYSYQMEHDTDKINEEINTLQDEDAKLAEEKQYLQAIPHPAEIITTLESWDSLTELNKILNNVQGSTEIEAFTTHNSMV